MNVRIWQLRRIVNDPRKRQVVVKWSQVRIGDQPRELRVTTLRAKTQTLLCRIGNPHLRQYLPKGQVNLTKGRVSLGIIREQGTLGGIRNGRDVCDPRENASTVSLATT